MNNILLFNKECNLRCSVCHFSWDKDGFTGYGKHHPFSDELDPHELLRGLAQFAPYHIEATGSEPLMYKGFKELIANLPDKCTWAITSNTLLDIDGIDLSKCIAWTASWHDVNREKFEANLLKLKGHVPLSVSFVVEFDRCLEILQLANKMRQTLGVRVNLLRELNKEVSWVNTEQLDLLRSMPPNLFNVVEDDIPLEYKFERGFECKGGGEYICLYTDGKIFSCYSNAMNNKQLGDIRTFVKGEGLRDCWDECLGCSEDHKARTKKLEDK